MFASIVDRFSLCWNITKKIKIGVPRTEPLGAPAGSDSASAAARVRLYTWRWKRRKRSNAGEQLCVNTSLVNLTETVPTTKCWHLGWLNIPSGFKKWPAELAPSLPAPPPPLLPPPRCPSLPLTVSVFVCDIHLTVFDGLIPMIYFEYNETNDHNKEKKTQQHAILCFHRYNYVDL